MIVGMPFCCSAVHGLPERALARPIASCLQKGRDIFLASVIGHTESVRCILRCFRHLFVCSPSCGFGSYAATVTILP